MALDILGMPTFFWAYPIHGVSVTSRDSIFILTYMWGQIFSFVILIFPRQIPVYK